MSIKAPMVERTFFIEAQYLVHLQLLKLVCQLDERDTYMIIKSMTRLS